ncbi:MAG: heme-binding protein, partial [Kiritimatiellaeota bacterium]|nr:heme-binding protein [Kiritimatiellota bacterium]
MKYATRILLIAGIVITGTSSVMAIEEAAFKTLKNDGKFELREYAPHILAETVVDGSLEQAGNQAFGRLFRYISGANRSHNKVAMTAPVGQQRAGEKLAMTAPVGQQRAQDKWAVSFMMPAGYTLETLPVPDDPQVKLRLVPARRMAAVRYSGFWSEKSYLRHKQELEAWIRKQSLTTKGEPVWARYNPP